MATRGGSFDYDEYTEEPGARGHPRYVNTDTIGAGSDSEGEDRRLPPSHTEETPVEAPGGAGADAPASRERSSSEGEEGGEASKSSGRMAKLFGKGKNKDSKEKEDDKKSKKEKKKKSKKNEEKDKKGKNEDDNKEKKDKKKKGVDGGDGSVSQPRMPGFGRLGGFFKRHKKDSNTSNDSEDTPPKHTSTPPSHRYPAPATGADISSDAPAPHDQTFPASEHSAATSAAAMSDVFDEPEVNRMDLLDPRARFGGPPPETIPMLDEAGPGPLGYVPPPMVPMSDAHLPPPVPEDTTAPKDVPYTYPARGKKSISQKIRAPLDKVLVSRRSPKFQQGDGVAPLRSEETPPITRCSTFIVVLLVSGFILGIILTAMGSVSDTLSVIGPCFLGLSFFGLVGKIFFTLWWEEDPIPQFNKVNAQLKGFLEKGTGKQEDGYNMYPMYPTHSSQPVLSSYTQETEINEGTRMTLGPDEVPDTGLRFTDSDMDEFPPSQEGDTMDPYKRPHKDSLSSEDLTPQHVKPSFV